MQGRGINSAVHLSGELADARQRHQFGCAFEWRVGRCKAEVSKNDGCWLVCCVALWLASS
jgi:hypothetical protein